MHTFTTLPEANHSSGGVRFTPLDPEPDGAILLLRSLHYIVTGSIGLRNQDLKPYHIALDTEAGYDVIRSSALPDGWESQLLAGVEIPKLGDANGRPLRLSGAIEMKIRFHNTVFRTIFVVSKRLAVDVLIGTTFLNHNVRAIECMDQRVRLRGSACVPILATNTVSTPETDVRLSANEPVDKGDAPKGGAR